MMNPTDHSLWPKFITYFYNKYNRNPSEFVKEDLYEWSAFVAGAESIQPSSRPTFITNPQAEGAD